jgi:hypothetical protein
MTRIRERQPCEMGSALPARSLSEALDDAAREAGVTGEAAHLNRWHWTCPAFVESVFDFTLPALRTEAG